MEKVANNFWKGEFLYYHNLGKATKNATTDTFAVHNRETSSLLGHIKWYHWRRYVFVPINCILDSRCMREISDFCDTLTEEVKSTWKGNVYTKFYPKGTGQMKFPV